MHALTPLAIVVAAGLISGTILYADRYQVWNDAPLFVVHDTWGGDLMGCLIEGTPPDMKATCTAIGVSARD